MRDSLSIIIDKFENYYFLSCKAVQFRRSSPTFLTDVLPHLESKSEPSKKPASAFHVFLAWFAFDPKMEVVLPSEKSEGVVSVVRTSDQYVLICLDIVNHSLFLILLRRRLLTDHHFSCRKGRSCTS
jgi:hypothetical protein